MLYVFQGQHQCIRKSGAYTLEDYKVEGDMVYLKFMSPSVDTYQYESRLLIMITSSFFQDWWKKATKKVGQSTMLRL